MARLDDIQREIRGIEQYWHDMDQQGRLTRALRGLLTQERERLMREITDERSKDFRKVFLSKPPQYAVMNEEMMRAMKEAWRAQMETVIEQVVRSPFMEVMKPILARVYRPAPKPKKKPEVKRYLLLLPRMKP